MGDTKRSHVAMASSIAKTAIEACDAIRIRRRSIRSASNPDGSASAMHGTVNDVVSIATIIGLALIETIIQLWPTSWTHVPAYEKIEAIQSARKAGWRKGVSIPRRTLLERPT